MGREASSNLARLVKGGEGKHHCLWYSVTRDDAGEILVLVTEMIPQKCLKVGPEKQRIVQPGLTNRGLLEG
jgi:hypothetical protein